MKYTSLVILLLLIGSFTIKAQTKKLNLNAFRLQYSFLNTTSNNLVFKIDNIETTNKYTFSVYNGFLKTNEFYSDGSLNFEQVSSRMLWKNDFRTQKIDSLNPYGSNNFGQAVLSGVINTFFNKL